MIYEIAITEVPGALNAGANLIIISGDGAHALVSSTTVIPNATCYQSHQMEALLAEPKWRQPCKDCEV